MRVYLSNIRRHWPIDRQETALDEALPGWRRGSVYRDELPPRKRQGRGVSDLTQRAILLRPSGHRGPDALTVATPAILGRTLSDFLSVLGELSAKNMTVTFLDTGMEIPPNATPTVIAAAGLVFEQACRRQKGEPGERGGDVSGRVRSEGVQARCQTIKERWKLSRKLHRTDDLLREARVSKPSAIKWLGLRPRDPDHGRGNQ